VSEQNSSDPAPGRKPRLLDAFTSWRTAAVALQAFPAGLPLGLVLITVPAWLAAEQVDIRTIGFVTLAQAPWTFKFLWSPLMDRWAPPFLGRKRAWALIAQILLMGATVALAAAGARPDQIGLVAAATFAVAFASATQDIALDAYAVEVLHPEEQGVASGARAAISRFAMTVSGRITIWAVKWFSWPALIAAQAAAYLPAAVLMVASPEPESPPPPPVSLRRAIWDPFVGFLRQHRALEIALFLVLYKFADNLASSLVSPFLLQSGYSTDQVGRDMLFISFFGNAIGAIAGGALTTILGLGHALWLFGFLQAFSNLGYAAIAGSEPNVGLLWTAMGIETLTTGMGTGAFTALLLRLTERRFSATQYALLSSIFALGRTIAGPLAGLLVYALGWKIFFLFTIASAAPGLLLLQRFVPLGSREPRLVEESPEARAPVTRAGLGLRAAAGGIAGFLSAAAASATLEALRILRTNPNAAFDPGAQIARLLYPQEAGDMLWLFGLALFGLVIGVAAAAWSAARRGVAA